MFATPPFGCADGGFAVGANNGCELGLLNEDDHRSVQLWERGIAVGSPAIGIDAADFNTSDAELVGSFP